MSQKQFLLHFLVWYTSETNQRTFEKLLGRESNDNQNESQFERKIKEVKKKEKKEREKKS